MDWKFNDVCVAFGYIPIAVFWCFLTLKAKDLLLICQVNQIRDGGVQKLAALEQCVRLKACADWRICRVLTKVGSGPFLNLDPVFTHLLSTPWIWSQ